MPASVRTLRRLMGSDDFASAQESEVKRHDRIVSAAIPISTNVALNVGQWLLNAMISGVLDGQRLGQQIRMLRLFLKGNVYLNQGTGISPVFIRMVVFVDTQQNGLFQKGIDGVGADGMLENTGTASIDDLAMRDPDNFKRYVCLVDKRFCIGPGSTGSTVSFAYHTGQNFEISIPLGGMVTQYDAAASVTPLVTDIMTHGIWLMIFADQSNLATIDFISRLSYTDS